MSTDLEKLPDEAAGLRLIRFHGDKTTFCEMVMFRGGRGAVGTTLRRAGIAGRVEADGEVADHQADVHAANGDLIGHVALDAASYRSLKTRWMRCKVEAVE